MTEGDMKKLPGDQVLIEQSGDNVVASLFEDRGYRHWEKYPLSELPNELISRDDLKRFGIDIVNSEAGGGN